MKSRLTSIYRQKRLQFRPPLEEIQAKYFREMKKFIAIPSHFKGVGDGQENLIFPSIIERHSSGFITCYFKAGLLFKRLVAEMEKFQVRMQTVCAVVSVNMTVVTRMTVMTHMTVMTYMLTY